MGVNAPKAKQVCSLFGKERLFKRGHFPSGLMWGAYQGFSHGFPTDLGGLRGGSPQRGFFSPFYELSFDRAAPIITRFFLSHSAFGHFGAGFPSKFSASGALGGSPPPSSFLGALRLWAQRLFHTGGPPHFTSGGGWFFSPFIGLGAAALSHRQTPRGGTKTRAHNVTNYAPGHIVGGATIQQGGYTKRPFPHQRGHTHQYFSRGGRHGVSPSRRSAAAAAPQRGGCLTPGRARQNKAGGESTRIFGSLILCSGPAPTAARHRREEARRTATHKRTRRVVQAVKTPMRGKRATTPKRRRPRRPKDQHNHQRTPPRTRCDTDPQGARHPGPATQAKARKPTTSTHADQSHQ